MRLICLAAFVLIVTVSAVEVRGDGKVVPPQNYKGSLEERSQEAIIIFQGGTESESAVEDMILKIQVEGEAEKFAWIVPFPTTPNISKADPKLFSELFRYCERSAYRRQGKTPRSGAKDGFTKDEAKKIKVISREIVGDFEVAVVQENAEGGLNPWLKENGYQTLDDAEDILGFYRDKKYVFACIKLTSKALATKKTVESHPLRFEFKTGGRDGIYFPMKMTSLQTEPFDVNLYIFYRYWVNDNLSPYGYAHRGFQLRYRDWDSDQCEPDGGKSYSLPSKDPFLRNYASMLPTVSKLFQTIHPGKTWYLTNIQARRMTPGEVRQWKDDLWMFPYYTDRKVVPYDALQGGPAATGYPKVAAQDVRTPDDPPTANAWLVVGSIVAALFVVSVVIIGRQRKPVADNK